MIKIEGVGYQIGGQDILTDVSIDIPRGGVTALIGPNGAGKSTLLSLIARLTLLRIGTIGIDGMILEDTPSNTIARSLAILPQASEIAPRLTVAQLVRFGRYPHSKGRPTPQCLAKIDEAITRFDLGALQHRMLDTLSGGQRQRALIAMSYAQDTDYLLLDEPLNNLDITASRHLMKVLGDMAATKAKTIVIVLHDINYASAYADRIIAMRDGQVIADGPPDVVVTEPMLNRIFGTDARVVTDQGRPFVLV